MGEQKRSLLRQLYLPAVLCTALWGSAAPCVKRGYELFAVSADAPFSQLVFAGWRFALAGILVLLVTRVKGHRIVPKRDEIKPILAISLFQSMLQYVCYYIGLSGTTGTKGSVLSGTQTFFALLLAHCLLPNDKLNRRKTLGCICGFAGVLVLGLGGLNGFNLTGDGLVRAAARLHDRAVCGSVYHMDGAFGQISGRKGQPVRLPDSGVRHAVLRARARREYLHRTQSGGARAGQRRYCGRKLCKYEKITPQTELRCIKG